MQYGKVSDRLQLAADPEAFKALSNHLDRIMDSTEGMKSALVKAHRNTIFEVKDFMSKLTDGIWEPKDVTCKDCGSETVDVYAGYDKNLVWYCNKCFFGDERLQPTGEVLLAREMRERR